MENYNEIKYLEAEKRVRRIKSFYIHVLTYILVNLMLIFFKVKGDSHIKISQFASIIVWGFIILYQGMRVFIPNLIFGKHWEEKKFRQILDKEKETIKK